MLCLAVVSHPQRCLSHVRLFVKINPPVPASWPQHLGIFYYEDLTKVGTMMTA